jgi:hypothetical protein
MTDSVEEAAAEAFAVRLVCLVVVDILIDSDM